MLSEYRKAVWAAALGALASIVSVALSVMNDGITSEEWQLIATTVVGAIAAVVAVVRATNTPPAKPSPDPVPAPPAV